MRIRELIKENHRENFRIPCTLQICELKTTDYIKVGLVSVTVSSPETLNACGELVRPSTAGRDSRKQELSCVYPV
jgi:hypothetical protein